jgi:hypothetical protein
VVQQEYVILADDNYPMYPVVITEPGLSPAASYIPGFSLTDFTGYAKAAQVTGKVFAADMVSPTSTNLTTAVENMILAFTMMRPDVHL